MLAGTGAGAGAVHGNSPLICDWREVSGMIEWSAVVINFHIQSLVNGMLRTLESFILHEIRSISCSAPTATR